MHVVESKKKEPTKKGGLKKFGDGIEKGNPENWEGMKVATVRILKGGPWLENRGEKNGAA